MKTVFTNRELAHVWANRRVESGRGYHYSSSGPRLCSYSFSGPRLYSYATVIGEFLESATQRRNGLVVVSDGFYSTTTTRHQSYARGAVQNLPGYDVVRVPRVDTKERMIEALQERVYKAMVSVPSKRVYHTIHGALDTARSALDGARRILDTMPATARKGTGPALDARREWVNDMAARFEPMRPENRVAPLENALKTQYGKAWRERVAEGVDDWTRQRREDDAAERLRQITESDPTAQAHALFVFIHNSKYPRGAVNRARRMLAALRREHGPQIEARALETLSHVADEHDSRLGYYQDVLRALNTSQARIDAYSEAALAASRERRAAEVAALLKTHADKIRQWRHGTRCGALDSRLPTLLRLSADETVIETSRGARVPVSVAGRLWRYVQRVREGVPCENAVTNRSLGVYKIDNITKDGDVYIGCHTLKYAELERMAKTLSLTA